MLKTFSNNFSTLIPNNENYEAVISSNIASTSQNVLNSAITLAKINLSLKKPKDTTMRIDLIHKRMLKKFSPVNRLYLVIYSMSFSIIYLFLTSGSEPLLSHYSKQVKMLTIQSHTTR